MVRRGTFWLCILLVLSGGPLRLAEAAADLTRSLAVVDGDLNLEPVDGGVGDEPADTLLCPTCDAFLSGLEFSAAALAFSGFTITAQSGDSFIDPSIVGSLPARPVLPSRAQERARLQRFLF